MICRRMVGWTILILPVLGLIWAGISFLIYLPVDETKVHPSISDIEDPYMVSTGYIMDGGSSSILILTDDHKIIEAHLPHSWGNQSDWVNFMLVPTGDEPRLMKRSTLKLDEDFVTSSNENRNWSIET